jgi:hypothetical protein
VTADRRLSAQYEHTVAVTDDGCLVLTVQNQPGAWEPPGRISLETTPGRGEPGAG